MHSTESGPVTFSFVESSLLEEAFEAQGCFPFGHCGDVVSVVVHHRLEEGIAQNTFLDCSRNSRDVDALDSVFKVFPACLDVVRKALY